MEKMLKRVSTKKQYKVEFIQKVNNLDMVVATYEAKPEQPSFAWFLDFCRKGHMLPDEMRVTDPQTGESVTYCVRLELSYPHMY